MSHTLHAIMCFTTLPKLCILKTGPNEHIKIFLTLFYLCIIILHYLDAVVS